jgi:hypothetical protein
MTNGKLGFQSAGEVDGVDQVDGVDVVDAGVESKMSTASTPST